MVGITLLGLGPGDPAKLTRAAWDVLCSINEIWLRTNQHPTAACLAGLAQKFILSMICTKEVTLSMKFMAPL